jgi:hypothetical protein
MPRLEPDRPAREIFIDYLTAADLMGVQPGVLLRWLREGEFPGERLRVKWHITLMDITNELGATPNGLTADENLKNENKILR